MFRSPRRRAALAGVATMTAAAFVLAGCSGSSSSSSSGSSGSVDGSGKTLNVLVAASGLYGAEQKQWFKDTSAAFKKETGATVKFETFASANDELTKIQTSVLSSQGPDIYGLGTTFTPTAYSTGAFVKLDDKRWDQLGGKDKFVQADLGISGPDADDQIGIPFASRPFVMAYNTKLLAAAGIDAPADTWDGLTDQAKQLTGDGVYGMALAYADSYDPWKFVWGMSVQAGNPIISGKKADLDSSEVKAAYTTYFDWVTKDKVVDPASTGWTNPQAVAAFADGKAAFLPMTTSSSQATLDASAVKDDYAYALMPTVPPGESKRPSGGKDAASILSGDNWVIAQYSKNQDLAFALMKMLTNKQAQLDYYKIFGDLPTNAAAAKQLEENSDKLAPVVSAAQKSVGTPFSGAWSDTQLALVNVVVQAIPDLASGGVSSSKLDSLLQTAQDSAQSSVDKAK